MSMQTWLHKGYGNMKLNKSQMMGVKCSISQEVNILSSIQYIITSTEWFMSMQGSVYYTLWASQIGVQLQLYCVKWLAT